MAGGKEVRLAHGWKLLNRAGLSRETIRDFVRSPVRSVPPPLAVRVGPCHIELLPCLNPPELNSRWTHHAGLLEIDLAAEGIEPHDFAMEMLAAIGEHMWERTTPIEREAWLRLLASEIAAGGGGEIDGEVFDLKQALLASAEAGRNLAAVERYAARSYAVTLAEYVHCFWHDVTVRSGVEHLTPVELHRRFRLFARWFSPHRRLFAFTESAEPHQA